MDKIITDVATVVSPIVSIIALFLSWYAVHRVNVVQQNATSIVSGRGISGNRNVVRESFNGK